MGRAGGAGDLRARHRRRRRRAHRRRHGPLRRRVARRRRGLGGRDRQVAGARRCSRSSTPAAWRGRSPRIGVGLARLRPGAAAGRPRRQPRRLARPPRPARSAPACATCRSWAGCRATRRARFPSATSACAPPTPTVVPDALVQAWARRSPSGTTSTPGWRWPAARRRSTRPRCDAGDRRLRQAGRRCRIGIARDAAFHFYYEDNLAPARARWAPSSCPFRRCATRSCRTSTASTSAAAIPRLHAAQLAANAPMREAVARLGGGRRAHLRRVRRPHVPRRRHPHARRRHAIPCSASCAGVAVMHDRLQALGYVEVETQRRTLLGGAGSAHARPPVPLLDARRRPRRRLQRAASGAAAPPSSRATAQDNVLGSYVHVHWASNPLVAEGFVAACARFAESRP